MISNNIIDQATAGVAPIIESVATGTIRPGALLRLLTDGTVGECGDILVTGHRVPAIFAVSDIVGGMSYGDSYSDGDRVYYRSFRAGDIVLAWCAPEQVISIGDLLSCADATSKGNLVLALNASRAVAMAIEAGGAGASPERIKVSIT